MIIKVWNDTAIAQQTQMTKTENFPHFYTP
jgi:hypothetical protein